MTISQPPLWPGEGTGNIHFLAERLRQACKHAALDAQKATIESNFRGIPVHEGEDDHLVRSPRVLNQDPRHPGSPAEPVDIEAHDAAVDTLRKDLEADLGIPPEKLILAGEEVPKTALQLEQNDYIARLDACDGTKAGKAFWFGHASVVLLEQVRFVGNIGRARHIAGAIGTAHGIVSWTNLSVFDRTLGRYPQVHGQVYLEDPRFVAERLVPARRWKRNVRTLAAVAHSTERYEEVRKIAAAHALQIERLSTAGGTPLAPALIGGDVGSIIEPHDVTLHDSSLLIPHQLLGGAITDLDGKPLDYLRLYENNGLTLDPNDKPVPGYIAWGGLR